MGNSGGTSTTTSSSVNWPSWGEPFGQKISKMGENWLDTYTRNGKFNTGLSDAAVANLTRYQSADFLNPENDPTLRGQEDAIKRAGAEAFRTNDAQIAGSAAQAGNLLSTKTAAARSEAARRSADDVAGQIAALRGKLYGDRMSLQAQSIAPALTQADDELTKIFQAASIVRGSGGSGTSTTQQRGPSGFLGLF
jgi:hypothetical protein